ncbi:hypothetical protein B9Z19DRAFT_758265 [Tuber borchii]|uniref:Uncharacterized protein n=1 Tax=Tuber borchii TaxID=42251 RepID=A0A2T6ZXK1_TUBBO|nr:hypothetical protein B9Z19DRAFT_758265 [Tuber borchii]
MIRVTLYSYVWGLHVLYGVGCDVMGWHGDGMGWGIQGKIPILVDVWLSLCFACFDYGWTDTKKNERTKEQFVFFFISFFFHPLPLSISLFLSLFSFPSLLIRECRYVLRAHTCFLSAASSLIGVGGWELRHSTSFSNVD